MMKNIKTLILAAVAILFGLTSCNNDSNEVPVNGDDFRVSLSFVDLKTYANSEVATKNTKVTITDGYLLFTNATDMITDVYTIKAAPANADYKEIDAAALGSTAVILDKVSGTSTKVYMIANKGTLVAVPVIGASATTFMKSAMKVEDQGTYAEVTSTGSATLATVVGKPDERTAAISLTTQVSRIQIKALYFAGFSAGNLDGIFINSYYPTMELNGTAIGSLVGSTTKTDYVSGSTIFPTNLNGYVFDDGLTGPINIMVTPSLGAWGYNLFASATPQIVLKLSGVVTTEGLTLGEQYVTIHGFRDAVAPNADVTTLAGGMIYTFDSNAINIDAGDLGPEPGMKPIKVDVTVTTVTWGETTVIPNM